MMIWKLTPTDVESDHWNGVTYKGEVIVRAEDQEQARHLAHSSFVIARDARLSPDSPLPPWRLPELVTCETIDDWEGETDGKVQVLYPVHYAAADRRREAEYLRALGYQAEHQITDLRTLGGIIHNHLLDKEVTVTALKLADGVARIGDWANEVKETGESEYLPLIAAGLRKIAAELERQMTHIG